jgi:hypothetical protein
MECRCSVVDSPRLRRKPETRNYGLSVAPSNDSQHATGYHRTDAADSSQARLELAPDYERALVCRERPDGAEIDEGLTVVSDATG